MHGKSRSSSSSRMENFIWPSLDMDPPRVVFHRPTERGKGDK